MGQVASVGQIHAEHRVAVLTQGGVHRIVGVGAAVGLHIGVVGPKELAGPFACDILHHVHALAAAVIAFAGIALAYLLVSTVAAAASTAGLTKFSDAISSMLRRWRSYSA